jgi:hypothetical protein
MWLHVACEAVEKGCCLELQYDGYSRIVEVHVAGTNREGSALLRGWQVRGGSVSGERAGWKLFRLDEARGALLFEERSQAPQTGYKRDDPAIAFIRCQV